MSTGNQELPPRVAVPLADGFEEIEAVTVVDVLRRAGIVVRVLGLHTGQITGSHGITINTDARLMDEVEQPFDAIVLPGGVRGATNLRDDPHVQEMIRGQAEAGRLLAAICAGPIALSAAGVLKDKRATGYPGHALECREYSEERVVVDGDVITSRGVGTAMDFALTIVSRLVGEAKADALRGEMLIR